MLWNGKVFTSTKQNPTKDKSDFRATERSLFERKILKSDKNIRHGSQRLSTELLDGFVAGLEPFFRGSTHLSIALEKQSFLEINNC